MKRYFKMNDITIDVVAEEVMNDITNDLITDIMKSGLSDKNKHNRLTKIPLKNEIRQYIINDKNKKIGCVIAGLIPYNDENGQVQYKSVVHMGFSILHENDKFDKEKGIQIARGRALTGRYPVETVKHRIGRKFNVDEFKTRLVRYYKDKQIQ